MIALALSLALTAAPAPDAGAEHVEVLPSAEAVFALPALHAKGTHVVHFWATWCEPCLEELPAFLARARELSAEGVDFTFLSVDPQDALEGSVVPMLVRLDGFYPAFHHYLIAGTDADADRITAHFSKSWPGGLPATFVFRDGKKIGEYRGAREAQALEHLGKSKPARR